MKTKKEKWVLQIPINYIKSKEVKTSKVLNDEVLEIVLEGKTGGLRFSNNYNDIQEGKSTYFSMEILEKLLQDYYNKNNDI